MDNMKCGSTRIENILATSIFVVVINLIYRAIFRESIKLEICFTPEASIMGFKIMQILALSQSVHQQCSMLELYNLMS